MISKVFRITKNNKIPTTMRKITGSVVPNITERRKSVSLCGLGIKYAGIGGVSPNIGSRTCLSCGETIKFLYGVSVFGIY